MDRKYTNPQAADYLLEAKACELVCKELRRVAEKYNEIKWRRGIIEAGSPQEEEIA